jgi:hypothetical protein
MSNKKLRKEGILYFKFLIKKFYLKEKYLPIKVNFIYYNLFKSYRK